MPSELLIGRTLVDYQFGVLKLLFYESSDSLFPVHL